MASNVYVELDIPEVNKLADLTGVRRDLEAAQQFAIRLRELRGQEQYDSLLVDALTTAVLVRYARAFGEGVRHPLNKLDQQILESLSEDQREKHEELRKYRDCHIAHSVNSFEENIPIARYWVETVQQDGIEAIECNSVSVIGMSVGDVEDVVEITSILLSRLDERLKDEKANLLKLVRQIPIDKILSGPRQARETGATLSVTQRRRRF